ncbi:lysophospholipid acyltransferase family protein [Paracraurococcus lichenis]|uniref:Lauroyl acyltransferase n=1 Tax=Paracraurococcus lichenis TaxID=3064888 RepID=A0ABT9E216_9PROT|nr:lauroyl acyltransferase [Paracraurococcus sp. LOR1-02]MDO9710199.1 lauroyl acyltransferase [Paracraurococcus sp. LOR1-02]
MRRFQFALERLAVRLVLALARALGPVGASDAGGWLARRLGPLLPVSGVARGNLARALPELDAAARERVLREMWENLGRTVGELAHLPALEWEIVGAEHLAPIAAAGGPAIMLSGHIGNWEVLPPALARLGIRMGSVYRAADNPFVDALVNGLRAGAVAGEPLPLFPKGSQGARAALKFLAGGGVLGMLADQKLNDGIAVPFLGRPAMTAPAPAQLALRFRCPVIPGRVQRLGPCRFRLVVDPPLPLPDLPDRQAAIRALTLAINDRLSAWIRERPAEWLWLHRRWPKPG